MYASWRLRRMAGLSMIELVIFIVIVSIAVAGVLSVLTITAKNSADPQLRKQALAIAEALLEEIELAGMTYCDPADANVGTAQSASVGANGCAAAATVENVGAESGNARPYDNVNDYVAAYGTAKPLTGDINNSTATIPPGYNASVTITPEVLNDISSDAVNTNVLRITVNVSYGNDSITLEGYRTRYAPNFVR